MRIPTRAECLALLRQMAVPPHVVVHSLRVAQVGTYVTRHLNLCSETLEIRLVEAGALLHDVTKMHSIETGEDHARTGDRFLRPLGYPAVAEVVRQHIYLDPRPLDAPLSEAQVVFYADKRIQHDRIVMLSERFADLMTRYAQTPKHAAKIAEISRETERLEARIFQRLPFDPADLNELNTQPIEETETCRDI
jgi:uncharacterized protein